VTRDAHDNPIVAPSDQNGLVLEASMIGAEDVLEAISIPNRGAIGCNGNTSVRHASLSLSAAAHRSCRRSSIGLALAYAVAIVPYIAAADPIWQQSPTVIVDTANPPAGHAFFVGTNGIDEDFFSAMGWYNPVFGGQHGNGTNVDPSQWVDNAVWIPWTNNGVPRMNGFFNFDDGNTLSIGMPWIVPSNNLYIPWQFNWATMSPPDNSGFVVESGFAWNDG
jgi:hypothetical protein